MDIHFNVLTRVSRPHYFATCRQSVECQLHRAVRQVVSIDSDACVEAVAGLPTVRVERARPEQGSFPYNLYFNRLYQEVDAGWVLFLDDDDVLASPWALSDLAAQIRAEGGDPDVLFLWKVWFPAWETVVPRTSFGQVPTACDINTSGVCFHSKHLARAQWDGDKLGDFRLIQRLHQQLTRTVWIDQVLTAQQDDQHLGSREDRPLSPAARPVDSLARMAALVSARDAELREVSAAATAAKADAKADVARLQGDLEATRSLLARTQGELGSAQLAVASLQADLTAALAESGSSLRQAREELTAARAVLDQARAEAEELRSSKSWRWTRPLRRARGVVRRYLR